MRKQRINDIQWARFLPQMPLCYFPPPLCHLVCVFLHWIISLPFISKRNSSPRQGCFSMTHSTKHGRLNHLEKGTMTGMKIILIESGIYFRCGFKWQFAVFSQAYLLSCFLFMVWPKKEFKVFGLCFSCSCDSYLLYNCYIKYPKYCVTTLN